MSKTPLVFATNNAHKLEEVQAMLPDYEILGLKAIGCFEDIPETAETLEGNALIKAKYVTDNYTIDCFADDTGLEVFSLNNAPGVYSARYSGPGSNAERNMMKLLNNLKDHSNRSAQFRTHIALIKDGEILHFEGICKGTILKSKRGNKGFGYDPIFQPEGYSVSFAEMNMDEKSSISHRGIAIRKLIHFLKSTS